MSEPDPRHVEIVERLWTSVDADEVEDWLALCDEEMVIRNPDNWPNRGPYKGHEGVHEWAQATWEVVEGLHHEIVEYIAVDENTMISAQRIQGKMRHTKLPMDAPWAAIWTFRNGKALSATGYFRPSEALEAAGVEAP